MVDKKFAFLFPGQGAQYQGMALDFLAAGSAAVKNLFDLASDAVGKDMESLLRDTDAETLMRTDVSQPAITLANLAAAAYLGEQGIRPAACAGFSLGEYAALAVAGVVSTEDCFRLVKVRGEFMQEAADQLRAEADTGAGGDRAQDNAPGMAAVIGLPPEQVEALIAKWTAAGLAGLYAANINSKRQVVVSGTAAALTEAENRFKEAGARRVIRLKVAGPFHSPLIAGAAEKFRPVLETAVFHDPAIPLFSNVTGKRVISGEEAKKLALEQITKAVRWTEEEQALSDAGGFDAVLETGPGKVLQGLWKDSGGEPRPTASAASSDSTLPCYPAGTVEDIKSLEGIQ
ncbi:malonyl CoA-acyl carrier protein transacylase [Spirochaetia bacterium]|nr:malonyl CoA-acyl carrier protein transacylase [Spirochaetia bacterium]